MLHNVSFKYKLSLPVLMLSALLVGQSVMTNIAMDELTESSGNIYEKGVQSLQLSSELLIDFQGLNGRYYRYLTEQSAGVLEDGAAKMMALKEEAQAIEEKLSHLSGLETGGYQEELALLKQQFKDVIIGSEDDGLYDVSAQMMQLDVGFVLKGTRNYADLYDQFTDTLVAFNEGNKTRAYNHYQAVSTQSETNTQRMMVSTIASVLLVLLVSFVIVRNTLRCIQVISQATSDLAQGEKDVDVERLARKDELGNVVDALHIFQKNKQEIEMLQQQRESDAQRAAQQRKEEMNLLASDFQQRVQSVIQALSAATMKLEVTSDEMSQTISNANQLTEQSSQEAGTTSQNVQSVASAAEQMSATIREISTQIQKTREMVEQSVSVVDHADRHAQELSTASQKVQEVIELIADIAGQINLLALNATIESARAGEAGKGFAVVAGEVKNLANQTDKSIQEIEKVIGEMNHASTNIIGSLEDVKSSVRNISEVSGSVASAVEEQSATTNDIAHNMQSAAVGTKTISEHLTEINQATLKSRDASQQLHHSAADLSGQTSKLEEDVEVFIASLKADA